LFSRLIKMLRFFSEKFKKNYDLTVWLVFYLLIFSFLLFNSFNYLDPDLGWHLRVGRDILATRSVPHAENYDYTMEGRTWVDHEWLPNAAMYWVYDHWGYIALNILFALLIILTLVILNIFIYRSLPNAPPAARTGLLMFFQLFGIFAAQPHLGIRIQEIALLFIVLLLLIIWRYIRTGNRRILFWLPPLFFLWANMHGSFLIGIFILFFTAAMKAAENILAKYKTFAFLDFRRRLNFRQITALAAFSLLSAAATLLNPYGIRLYVLLGGYADNFYMGHIAEWLPAYYRPLEYAQLIYCALFSAIIILMTVFALTARDREENKIDLWYYALSLFFLVLAFKSKRHFPPFFVISLLLMVDFLCRNIGALPPRLAGALGNNRLVKTFVYIGAVISISGLAAQTNFTGDPFASPRLCRRFPCGAVSWLKVEAENHNLIIFNEYGWGGYLVWNWPEEKIFIDGRFPQYPLENKSFLEEYFEFSSKDEETTAAKLNQYGINAVLLPRPQKQKLDWFEKYILQIDEDKINESENYLRDYLSSADDWQLTYNDNASIIYMKTKTP